MLRLVAFTGLAPFLALGDDWTGKDGQSYQKFGMVGSRSTLPAEMGPLTSTDATAGSGLTSTTVMMDNSSSDKKLGNNNAYCSTSEKYMSYGIPDNDPTEKKQYVRLAFRSGADESEDHQICINGACVPSAKTKSTAKHCGTGEAFGRWGANKNPGSDGNWIEASMTNSTLVLKNRGQNYGSDTPSTTGVTVKGPGTFYPILVDLTSNEDYLKISTTADDDQDVYWTGNYSQCVNMAGLEAVYMDENLSPGNKYVTAHNTEETQNHQDDLCHNVLTGKVLPPAPVSVKAGKDATVTFTDGGARGGGEGFEMHYDFDDWHCVDVSDDDLKTLAVKYAGSGVECRADIWDWKDSARTKPPATAPASITFHDEDTRARKIKGSVTRSDGDANSKWQVRLVKERAPGKFGFVLTDQPISNGPIDTFGSGREDQDGYTNTGAGSSPYYASGTSSGTEAPAEQGHMGNSWLGTHDSYGGGNPGARIYYTHGDMRAASLRGENDFFSATQVEVVNVWDCTGLTCAIESTRLMKAQGSPPSPHYRLASCDGHQQVATSYGTSEESKMARARFDCMRKETTVPVIDVAQVEPSMTFHGDLDPKSRVITAEITVMSAGNRIGQTGYTAYWTQNGDDSLLTGNHDFGTAPGTAVVSSYDLLFSEASLPTCGCGEVCANNNPYSPYCTGKSCPYINILPGSGGEYFISRFDSVGNAHNPQSKAGDTDGTDPETIVPDKQVGTGTTYNTAQRNFSDNEYAEIHLPTGGWLTPIVMDVPHANVADAAGVSDSLKISSGQVSGSASATADMDLTQQPIMGYIDVNNADEKITWVTNMEKTGHGFTFIWQPQYQQLQLQNARMADGAGALRFVNRYNTDCASGTTDDQYDDGDREDQVGDGFVAVDDWLTPNVTCTPTTMHCPLPTTWAHINYTTPSLYPEPAEGSCLQQKTGTSSLHGCGDKKNLNTRWYSASSPTTTEPGVSLQNTNAEDNGQNVAGDTASQQYGNWAGNCGDATSYFWFEKIACGSTRTFDTERSLILDFVQLTPTWEDIQAILDLYYTTKAPLDGGITFITADYHVPPVLPPKVNCTCQAPMDAYASLLSVQSKTPTPGAPITLDPEVLNTGLSKMVASLRMYKDPTYSLPASSELALPIVVTRFYLEVSTKFTRNRITLSDCTASDEEAKLNRSAALKPRWDYCDNSTFDTASEMTPAGITHIDRLSMKKFKFQTGDRVFMQCKIRACAQQPCGVCQSKGRQLQDLAPIEGEMFAPPVSVKVSPNDPNAMTFPNIPADGDAAWSNAGTVDTISTGQAPAAQPTVVVAPVVIASPIQVKSEMTFSTMSAEWAVENKDSLASTLRGTLQLTADEELVILAITAARRQLSQGRSLQASGVKVDFVIGLKDAQRASTAQAKVNLMASGNTAFIQNFARLLDTELTVRGKAPVALDTASIGFKPPTQTQGTAAAAAISAQAQRSGTGFTVNMPSSQSQAKPVQKVEGGSSTPILTIAVAVLATALILFMYQSSGKKQKQTTSGADFDDINATGDAYSAKIAASEGAVVETEDGPRTGHGALEFENMKMG